MRRWAALAGSNVGGGHGSIAGVIGAIAGGLGTQAAQRSLGTKNAIEVTVKLDDSKRLISIVQEADVPLVAGQRVRVLTGGGNDRVVPF
ncbi:outer membrane lipoprotein [Paludibacterium denitrificans]|uniref:outer membrane lipoprotein n=1 Tax=Paludibacterium denitrificans TaxID=2675226 RepID=UPI001E335467|nr:hypothetical protein [Paludibacterium denitrificans]